MTVIERPLYGVILVQTFDLTGSPFVLDQSKLDYSPLGAPGDKAEWRDWTATANNVTIRRGMRSEGIELFADTGIATITLIDPGEALDPETGIHPGQPARVIARVPGQPDRPLFTGKVYDARRSIERDQHGRIRPALTLVFADAVQTFNGITRYGATGPETFRSRISRLAQSTSEPVQLPATSPTALQARIVTEASLSDHFTLACNGAGAMWWVGADGVTRFQYRALNSATDLGVVWNPDLIHADTASGLDGWANRIYQTRISAVPDPDNPGNWLNDETTELIYDDPQSVGRWGERPATYPLAYVYDQGDDSALCMLRMRGPNTTPTDTPSSVTVNAQSDLARYSRLEIGGRITVSVPGAYAETLITGIHHTITPTRWLVTLTLIGATNT
jgi:hypothetical protein